MKTPTPTWPIKMEGEGGARPSLGPHSFYSSYSIHSLPPLSCLVIDQQSHSTFLGHFVKQLSDVLCSSFKKCHYLNDDIITLYMFSIGLNPVSVYVISCHYIRTYISVSVFVYVLSNILNVVFDVMEKDKTLIRNIFLDINVSNTLFEKS